MQRCSELRHSPPMMNDTVFHEIQSRHLGVVCDLGLLGLSPLYETPYHEP